MEFKESTPHVIVEMEKLNYHINEISMAGGSAGHCLSMLYVYRGIVEYLDTYIPVK